jgi:hypothetical protein
MEVIKSANVALRFLLELCVLGATSVLGVPDRTGTARQNRTRHRRSIGSCGGVGPGWSVEFTVAVAGSLAPCQGVSQMQRRVHVDCKSSLW